MTTKRLIRRAKLRHLWKDRNNRFAAALYLHVIAVMAAARSRREHCHGR